MTELYPFFSFIRFMEHTEPHKTISRRFLQNYDSFIDLILLYVKARFDFSHPMVF